MSLSVSGTLRSLERRSRFSCGAAPFRQPGRALPQTEAEGGRLELRLQLPLPAAACRSIAPGLGGNFTAIAQCLGGTASTWDEYLFFPPSPRGSAAGTSPCAELPFPPPPLFVPPVQPGAGAGPVPPAPCSAGAAAAQAEQRSSIHLTGGWLARAPILLLPILLLPFPILLLPRRGRRPRGAARRLRALPAGRQRRMMHGDGTPGKLLLPGKGRARPGPPLRAARGGGRGQPGSACSCLSRGLLPPRHPGARNAEGSEQPRWGEAVCLRGFCARHVMLAGAAGAGDALARRSGGGRVCPRPAACSPLAACLPACLDETAPCK